MRSVSRTTRGIMPSPLAALVLTASLLLVACGGASKAASTASTATAVTCAVPNDGKTAFTSPDGTYRVTIPQGWSASCFNAAPFSNGLRATAPDGEYAVYVLPARPTRVPAGSDGVQLFVQNQGAAFLADQLKPDSITPCCVEAIEFAGTNGVDVQYDLATGGIASQAEFLAVAHDESPFVILGLFPSAASGPEDSQLHSMIFSSFTFL
jgi:hypothetical protein